ncbi:MAG: phage holin family protein [Gammaproteobacteria bacterium]
MDIHEPGPEPQPAEGRLFGAIRRLLTTFLAIAQTRAELLATELQEEVHRAASVLLWSFVALLFATLAVLMIAVTLLVAFWEEHRLLVAILISAAFVAVTIGTGLLARAKVRSKARFLSATLDELKRDRAIVEREP